MPSEKPRPLVEGSCAHPSTSPSGTFSNSGKVRRLITGLSATAWRVSSSIMPPLRSLVSRKASPNGFVSCFFGLDSPRSAASAFIESFSPPSSGVRLCFPWSDVRFGMIHIVSCLPDIKPE